MSSDDSDQRTLVAKIKWVFKNVSQANCFFKQGDVFCSDEFRVASLGNSLWRFELYPIGKLFDDIAIYLKRLWDDQGNRVTVSFELGFDDRHGWIHLQRSESNVPFQRGTSFGYYSFVDPNDSKFLDECLPADVLTIYCYMFSTTIESKSDIRITKALLSTHIPCEKISFVWKIKRFLNRKTDPSKTVCFDSPFSPDANPLHVTLSMNRFLDETYVRILVEGDSEYEYFFKCRIWHEKNEEDYLLCSKILSDFPYVESYLPLIKESEILSYPEVYLDNGTLKLNCEVCLVKDDIQCFSQCQSFKTSDQESVWYNSLRGSTDQKDKSKSPIPKN